ncbi:MAG TPA: phosphatidylinositol mannoside acyltransferase [Actinomycetota bacterium]|nr:phosphatidylinositol mannoside acyltransferase [Actinomycetota bacterium]
MTDLPSATTDAPGSDADERLTAGQRLSLGLYTSMERVAMRWPERPARALFRAYGALGYRLMPKVRATVARNYAQVLGLPPSSDLVQGAVREGFDLYARYWYETFAIRGWSREEMDRRFLADGGENIDKAIADGKGCIVALPHMGNWDAAGKWVAGHWKIVAAAEELRPRRMFELFLQHRRDLGMEIVPVTDDRSAGMQLVQMLADNYVVALVADRDLGGRGVECEMFGRIRRLPPGPALLSLTTGAPLLSCPTYTTDDGWVTRVSTPLEIERTGNMREDVTALTRLLAADWERAIAAKPTDWHMFQPAWDFREPPVAHDAGP